MITISLCMIVKNEEKTLPNCLKSVEGLADEIIIVDTGSSDKTRETARKFTKHVYDFQWIDDFSAARNFAFKKATCDYLMWLDADDVLLEEDLRAFLKLKAMFDPKVDVVMMRYHTAFDEHGRPTFSYYRERLIKRSYHYRWMEPVHEYISTPGANIITTQIAVTHTKKSGGETSGRNIRIYEARINAGETLSARGMYYYARELQDHGRYKDAIAWFTRFLESRLGWAEDNIGACGALSDCYLKEGQKERSLYALLRSFQYDTPRAEVCAKIGYHFKDLGNYRLAAYWFEHILSLVYPSESWGFVQREYWGYIPCLELCVCYDKLGEREKAAFYNEKAAQYKPGSSAVKHNREYFKSVNRVIEQAHR
ncbi:glycosyltransferase family 2 protein [Christensenellaceae bacterium OttesenSCG-928-M15]|nr:glycosyltransferase family 2 protein [Christensenellaceae bacterium OttesenSCG-928-M15]